MDLTSCGTPNIDHPKESRASVTLRRNSMHVLGKRWFGLLIGMQSESAITQRDPPLRPTLQRLKSSSIPRQINLRDVEYEPNSLIKSEAPS